MRPRTSSATLGWPLSARDTVATDTFACRATSLIVTLMASLRDAAATRDRDRPVPPGGRPRRTVQRRSPRHHFETRRLRRIRAAAREHRERARLDHPLHLRVVQRQILESEGERHLARFARLEFDPLEAAQL